MVRAEEWRTEVFEIACSDANSGIDYLQQSVAPRCTDANRYQSTSRRELYGVAALRQAELALIDGPGFLADRKPVFSYAHPIFWAPFIVIGDGGR